MNDTDPPTTLDRLRDGLRDHWPTIAAGATAAAIAITGIVTITGLNDDLDTADTLTDTLTVQIDDLNATVETLDGQVDKLTGVNDSLDTEIEGLEEALGTAETNLATARNDRDRAETRAEACEALPADVYALMDWVTLGRTNVYAAVAQGDALIDDQTQVLDDLTDSVLACDNDGPTA